MSELLGRVRAAFIADAPRSVALAARELVTPPTPHVGVICDVASAGVAGAVLALRLASATGASAALVCRWQSGAQAPPVAGVGARLAARRLAARLTARDVSARAAGRLALATLDEEPAVALATVGRALAAAGSAGVPAVVVVAGPRPVACDRLLAERDAIVVATSADAGPLAEVAAAGAVQLGPAVFACAHRTRAYERALAVAGLAAVGELGRAFEPAVRALA